MNPEALMKRVAEAIANSDARPLFRALDHTVVWKSAGGPFSFSGGSVSRDAIVMMMMKMASAYRCRRIETKDIMSAGDVVWGLFEAEVDYAPGPQVAPRTIAFEMAVRWRLRNGKVIEHQAFLDTAGLLAQQNARNGKTSVA